MTSVTPTNIDVPSTMTAAVVIGAGGFDQLEIHDIKGVKCRPIQVTGGHCRTPENIA